MDQLLYHCIPRVDDLIDVWIDEDPENIAPPDYRKNDSHFILLAGVSEDEVLRLMEQVKCRGDELSGYFRSQNLDVVWDVSVKPVFLFESLSAALKFHQLIQREHADDICDLAYELQLDYNEPWGQVKMIRDQDWDGICRRYCEG